MTRRVNCFKKIAFKHTSLGDSNEKLEKSDNEGIKHGEGDRNCRTARTALANTFQFSRMDTVMHLSVISLKKKKKNSLFLSPHRKQEFDIVFMFRSSQFTESCFCFFLLAELGYTCL